MRQPNLAGLQPVVRAAWQQAAPALRRAGVDYTVTSAYRSAREQAAIDPATNPYPVAAAGTSSHEKGLALDISIPASQRPVALPILAQYGFTNTVPADRVHFGFQAPSPEAPSAPPGASRAAGGAPPVLPPVPGAPGTATRPGVTNGSAGGSVTTAPAAAAPEAVPWYGQPGALADFDQRLSLRASARAAPTAASPWYAQPGALAQFDQQLGLNGAAPLPPAPALSMPTPVPALGFHPAQGTLSQQIQAAVNPGPISSPGLFAPPPLPRSAPVPPPPAPSPWASLAQGLLTGGSGLPGGSPAAVNAGLTATQLALGPSPPAPRLDASQPPGGDPVQQLTANATGPLAAALANYRQQTGGRNYIADLALRYRLAPDPAAKAAVISEAQQYGLAAALPALAQAPTPLGPTG